jgi:multicomponent K+:H+ antiporter subunit A
MLPFVGALLPGLMIRAGRNVPARSRRLCRPSGADDADDSGAGRDAGRGRAGEIEWLPQLGLSASFFLDGLGLLFAGMILGVGR